MVSEGTLLTQDPIGLAGGVNLYAYAGSNPISYADPFGLSPCKLTGRGTFNSIAAAACLFAEALSGIKSGMEARLVSPTTSALQMPTDEPKLLDDPPTKAASDRAGSRLKSGTKWAEGYQNTGRAAPRGPSLRNVAAPALTGFTVTNAAVGAFAGAVLVGLEGILSPQIQGVEQCRVETCDPGLQSRVPASAVTTR